MKARYHIIILTFLILQSWSLFAQDYLFDASILNKIDGLPSRTATDIVQDLDGFIWISTSGAISRYDGNAFKTYNNSFLKINGEPEIALAIDTNNNLWYSENKRANPKNVSGIINTKKDSLISMNDFSNGLFTSSDVVAIYQSQNKENDVFITTRQGVIYKYDGSFKIIFRFPNKSHGYKTKCEFTDDGNYWIISDNNIYKVNAQKEIIESYIIPIELHEIQDFVNFSPDNIIVKTKDFNNNNYAFWEINDGELRAFKPNIQNFTNLHYIQYSNQNRTFIAGESIFIQNSKGTTLFSLKRKEKISSAFICNSVLLDRQNTIWITTNNGVYKITQRENPFKLYEPNNSIRSVYRINNTLFIGGYNRNISIDLNTKNLPKFSDSLNYKDELAPIYNEDNPYTISSVYQDDNHHIFFGTTLNKIFVYDILKQEWSNYSSPKKNNLYQVFKNQGTNKLWIGTSQGLAYLSEKTKQVTGFDLPINSEGLEIKQFYQNSDGIWIVSNKGLFLMDSNTELIIKHYTNVDGLPSIDLNYLHEDSDGNFWLGTRDNGLFFWKKVNNTFKQFTKETGLSNNTIYAVYEDEFENLWLPSNDGLMCFNKKNLVLDRVYLPKDGVAHEEFNTFAHYRSKDSTLYFGGLNGVTSFHPKDINRTRQDSIQIFLTKLSGLDAEGDNLENKTNTFFADKKINLKHNSRLLEIEVSLLDYGSGLKHQYAYQIEGYQEDWIYTSENKITIINPSYGNYNINIKGKGSTGNWSSNILKLPLVVEAPFYLQWEFITLSLILIIVLVFMFFKWRLIKLQKDRKLLESEVKKRTVQIENDKQIIEDQAIALKELDNAKTQFFSNITHEFRTPLTLIMGPIEQVIEEQPPPTIFRRRMQGVLKNTKHILSLINQLLDLSKLESGQMKLEVVHEDIVEYTNGLVKRFQVLAIKKQQQLIFITKTKHWKTYFDKSKWNKILFNLISNAIKFTPDGKRIQIELKAIKKDNKDFIQLFVKDSGIGIDKKHINQIFNRFYQVDLSSTRANEGTGIGLSLVKELITIQSGNILIKSELGKGTTFEVLLPVLHNHPVKQYSSSFTDDFLYYTIDDPVVETTQENESEKEKLELLVVEDNDEMREYICQCLGYSLFNISEAKNGEEGLNKALALIPDLIVSDVMMPKKDGFELTENIRSNTSTSHIPIILLTAKASLENKLDGLKRGADAYLTKPFSPQELTLRIKNLIEIRTTLQQRYQKDAIVDNGTDTFEQEDVFISKLKTYITENINEPNLNGDTIGAHMYLSRIHLYRKLKALTNQSISEYVKTIRLEKALELLKEKQLNISEIAYQTGFTSVSHFSRTFKQAFGKSPSKM
jgi:signal transduction histidine kinase/CheY-like chemotaxis protein/ligand-binding sensor domain-containing protein